MHQHQAKSVAARGRILHDALGYDLLVWLLTRGRTRQFRHRLLDLARVTVGEHLLDIGCGTGTLAIEAKARVGPPGVVAGIDPSPEMINRARRKARRRADVDFREGAAECLPFVDGQFDVVTSTLMLHHLPRTVRETAVAEANRVLKPGGRMLAVDFGGAPASAPTLLNHLHRRRGHTTLEDITTLVRRARFDILETGQVGLYDLNFVLAVKPIGQDRS